MGLAASSESEDETESCQPETLEVIVAAASSTISLPLRWAATTGGFCSPDLGTTVAEVCGKMGASEAIFYNLEEENTRLKRMVLDLSLDKQMLQEVIPKKL
ncbi:hypothetical protein [Chromobacterium haemolyticum]|uniref:hypothetical protein n=1 Tax=Chromobacterium haemolyticum TaxID=394935 RepID=UPI001C382233